MPFPFDVVMKDLVRERTADFEAALGLEGDHPVRVLNVDLTTLSAATDIVLGFGEPLSSLTDLNFQAGRDGQLSSRVLMYNGVLHHRYHVPVRSVIVLLRREADDANLTGRVRYQSGRGGRSKLDFSFEIVPMCQQPLRRYLTGGLGLLPLAQLCRLPANQPLEQALKSVVRRIDKRLHADAGPVEAKFVLSAAYVVAGLLLSEEATKELYEGVEAMRESSTYQGILREGRIEQAVKMILRLGRKHFGDPSESVKVALQSITDVDRLDRVADQLDVVGSWQELLETP